MYFMILWSADVAWKCVAVARIGKMCRFYADMDKLKLVMHVEIALTGKNGKT